MTDRVSKAAAAPPPVDAVDVVTVLHRSRRHLEAFAGALACLETGPIRLRLIAVDTAADAGEARWLAGDAGLPWPVLPLSLQGNPGFGAAVNAGLSQSRTPWAVLLNPDTRVEPDWLRKLVQAARGGPRVGLVEARQTPKALGKPYRRDTLETPWSSAGGLLVRRRALDEVGGFSGRYFLYLEDVDLSLRLRRAGWRCLYCPDAVYEHVSRARTHPSPSEIYYSYRNTFYLYWLHAAPERVGGLYLSALLRLGRLPAVRRRLLAAAMVSHLTSIPSLCLERRRLVRQWGPPGALAFPPYG